MRFFAARVQHRSKLSHLVGSYPGEQKYFVAKEKIMRRTVQICFLVVLTCLTLPVCAGQRDNEAKQPDPHPAKSAQKTIRLACRVGLDGKTVVSDRDSRIWKVVNAEMLTGSEGRQVTIKAYREANSSEIRVTVVRLREERTTAKLDDAAFRR